MGAELGQPGVSWQGVWCGALYVYTAFPAGTRTREVAVAPGSVSSCILHYHTLTVKKKKVSPEKTLDKAVKVISFITS